MLEEFNCYVFGAFFKRFFLFYPIRIFWKESYYLELICADFFFFFFKSLIPCYQVDIICRNKGQMFLLVYQISINDTNVSGKVSSLPLAGEDTCFTNMGCVATCWLDSVAGEVFKMKVRFNFVLGLLCFGVCLFGVCFFFFPCECDFIALLIVFSFLLLKKKISHITL